MIDMRFFASTFLIFAACFLSMLVARNLGAQEKALKLAFAAEEILEYPDGHVNTNQTLNQPQIVEPIDSDFVLTSDQEILEASYDPIIGLPDYELGYIYDKGLFIRGADKKKHPYSVHIGGRLQVKHMGFVRDDETWTDSAGNTSPILNRNRFEIERARLNISGTAISPDLTYFMIFDGDSDGGSDVDQLAYIATYRFSDAFKVQLGRWKAATDREWIRSSRYFRMVDRSIATEFFRAGFTEGVWFLGDLGNHTQYETSFTNGLRTSQRLSSEVDDNLAIAATIFTEPWGSFGPGEQDYAYHCSPVIRIGASFAYDKVDDRSDVGLPLGDGGYLTLSDGTLLSTPGALAPGVTVLGVRTIKGGFDFAYKYRGWSFSTEYFVRSLQDITATGAIPVSKIDDHGYRAEMGYFLVPHRLDVNGRVSQVMGEYGDAFEYSLGTNYYWGNWRKKGKLDDRVNKLSFDVAEIKGAPITSGGADFTAGDDGVMFRSQVQVGF